VKVVTTDLPGVLVLEPAVYRDDRGFFIETYRLDAFRPLEIPAFVQDNHSLSVQGTLRGMHLQVRPPQAKLIRVVEGEIFDVAADVRRGSPTFGKWVATTLSADNFKQVYIPAGFAHGFCVLSPRAQVEYKCTDFYDPGGEVSLAWDDPTLAIAWPLAAPLLSPRDQKNPSLRDSMDRLPVWSTEL
jgi:dTDP-4-dehydrorhamnose 3,5-epimerase